MSKSTRCWRSGLGIGRAAVVIWTLLGVCVTGPAVAQDLLGLPSGQQTTDRQVDSDEASVARPVPDKLKSPRDTISTFLDAINRVDKDEHAWDDVVQCMDLSLVNETRGEELASKLIGVLNRLGRLDPGLLPSSADLVAGELSTLTIFPRPREHDWVFEKAEPDGEIVLALDGDGRWLFSARTMAGMDRLYESLKHLPIRYGLDERGLSLSLWIEGLMPASLGSEQFLTVKYWQWLGLAVLVFLGVVLEHVIRLLLRLVSGRLIARQRAAADPKSVLGAVRPLGLLAAGLFWLVTLRVLGLPDGALTVLLASISVFAILAGTWAAWGITDLVCEVLSYKAAHTATRFDDVLIPLIRKTIKVLIVAFGLIYAAGALNIPIMPMLTSLGIGGLAFAFAAKDTVENFFGSVAVLLDRPFEVGDWVVIGDVEGTVEEVGFRSTRVRTFYNSQVTVPNAALVRATVDNYGRRKYRRVKTHVGIEYDTPPEKIVAFTEGIRELVRTHPYTRKDYFQVWFHQFGPHSLDILLYVFHETPDWATELRERERLFLDIVRLADQLEIKFAFPTQTIHLQQDDPTAAPRPSAIPEAQTDQQAGHEGIAAAQRLIANQPWTSATPGPVSYAINPATSDRGKEEQKAGGKDATEDRTAGS